MIKRKFFLSSIIFIVSILLLLITFSCPDTFDEKDESVKRSVVYTSEGSIDSPIFLEAGLGKGITYSCQVNTEKSYYYTTELASDHSVSVQLVNMLDDCDIISYGTDSTFSTEVFKPFYGRTKEEGVGGGPGPNLYFVVDGSYTTAGSSYNLIVSSNGNSLVNNNYNRGSIEDPVLMPSGESYYSYVKDGTSYYKAPIKTGTNYCVNLFDATTLNVYSDSGFTLPITTFPFTAASNFVYISVSNGGISTGFSLEVVRKEGSPANPISLFVGKTNFLQVDDTSSYFIFPVESGLTYTAEATNISSNVDLYLYNSNNFTSLAGSSTNTGTDDESDDITASGSWITVKIDDQSGDGATFILEVIKN